MVKIPCKGEFGAGRLTEEARGDARAVEAGRAPASGERERALQEEVDIDLPAIAHRAMDLDRGARGKVGGFERDDLGVADPRPRVDIGLRDVGGSRQHDGPREFDTDLRRR